MTFSVAELKPEFAQIFNFFLSRDSAVVAYMRMTPSGSQIRILALQLVELFRKD